MANKYDVRSYVVPLGTKIAGEMGFELIDAELVKEGPGRYLRIYLDKEGGFTLDDCERFHRVIQPRLEHVDYDFLEVSSPGIDRPLKTDKDYARAIGAEIEVKLFKAMHGQKLLSGTLESYDRDGFVLKAASGEMIPIARKDTALVKPIIHFEDEDE